MSTIDEVVAHAVRRLLDRDRVHLRDLIASVKWLTKSDKISDHDVINAVHDAIAREALPQFDLVDD